jgi:hypothetical protein
MEHLARWLAADTTRRRLLGPVTGLPLASLVDLLTGAEADAAGRRQRRKKHHHHRRGDGKRNRKGKQKGKGKDPCSRAGQVPRRGFPCCQGLVEDDAGRCEKPVGCTTVCPANVCGSLPDGCGGTQQCSCSSTQICIEGTCQTCTVTCANEDPATCGTALQVAINAAILNGDTVYVCPGRYRGRSNAGLGFEITAAVDVIGAGEGDDPSIDTILDQQVVNCRVLTNTGGSSGTPVSLARLRVTGGSFGNGSGGGGGIFNDGVLSMTHCTVTANREEIEGGGGLANGATASLTMTSCTINQNSSEFGAGGVLNRGSLVLDGCAISANSSVAGAGGGITALGGEVTLRHNTSVQANTAHGVGGGIYNESAVVTIDASSVTDNTAEADFGGGIRNFNGPLHVRNGSTISGNTAPRGGGIFNSNDGQVKIDDSSVTGNAAIGVMSALPGGGGGIANEISGTVTITNSQVTLNTAQDEGGGIYNSTNSVVHLEGSTSVTENSVGPSSTPNNCDGDGQYTGTDRCGP